MKYNFIKFEKSKGSGRGRDMIRFYKNGIKFSKVFLFKNELTNYTFASLFYDREQKAIGLQFHTINNDNAYKLSKTKQINIRSFLSAFNTKVEEKFYDYKVEYDKDDKYFIVKL